MSLRRLASLALVFSMGLTPLALAQDAAPAFDRPPAGVDEALRARVKEFYALHYEGKFRQAEAFVCADSKDTFYDSDKRRWQSADILKITYDKDFKGATVLVSLGSEMRTRVGTIPAAFPMATSWKQQEDSWCYHILPPNKAVTATPFGSMQQTGPAKGVSAAEAPVRPDPLSLINAFKVPKREFLLKGYEDSSDEADIYNGMPGEVRLDIQAAEMKGLKWELSKKVLGAGEHATLKLKYTPPDKSAKPFFTINLLVEPLGASIPMRVVFDIPEEVKKKLPFIQK